MTKEILEDNVIFYQEKGIASIVVSNINLKNALIEDILISIDCLI